MSMSPAENRSDGVSRELAAALDRDTWAAVAASAASSYPCPIIGEATVSDNGDVEQCFVLVVLQPRRDHEAMLSGPHQWLSSKKGVKVPLRSQPLLHFAEGSRGRTTCIITSDQANHPRTV